jgi:hypothetical protein
MTTISATAINPTNITVSWTALTDATLNGGDVPGLYRVEYASTYTGNSGNPNYQWSEVGTSTGLSYTYVPGTVFGSGVSVYFRVLP